MTSRGLLVAGSWTAACLKGTGADTSGTFSARRLACATATCGQQAECHLSAALLQGASRSVQSSRSMPSMHAHCRAPAASACKMLNAALKCTCTGGGSCSWLRFLGGSREGDGVVEAEGVGV